MISPVRGTGPSAVPEPDPSVLSSLPPDEVHVHLGSSRSGLGSAEAASRLERFGPNTVRRLEGRRLARRFVSNFTHLMALLLWAGGGVAFAARLPQLALAIWLVNLINGLFSFWQEFKAERATEALRRLLPAYARVLRDGREERVPADELVPGDVVLLGEGDRISADARVVEETELRVDQSTLTGESHPVRRTSQPVASAGRRPADVANLVFAGTSAAAGRGTAVVYATGMRTEFGGIARLTQGTVVEQSPLQRELTRLSKVVGAIAVGAGVLFFVLAQLLTPMDLTVGFVFTLGMIVAFVPEGLLPTVTLALAMGTQRMAQRNALVKRLSAVEALGSASVVCTDKTGTLTQNEMTVRDVFLPSGPVEVGGVGYEPVGDVVRDGRPLQMDGDLRGCLAAGAFANDARLLPPDAENARWRILGDPTEGALKVAAAKAGLEVDGPPRLYDLPFTSARKRMSTVHQEGSERVLYTKGAPRELLELCTHARVDGEDVPLSDALRRRIREANDRYSWSALRVLAVARRTLPDDLVDRDPQALERDLTFLGLVAMMDPPREEVAEAVRTCRRAGIRIVMMTGDYGITAESIARRIGIVEGPEVRVVNGDEIDRMSDDDLHAILRGDVLFARTTPAHKLRVVGALQNMGEVVAVTGDGVNDAPALKKADIGVAMGLSGTDVAREAADMVLLDDNFASIVSAVEEGRAVFANIKKFTSYIFTSNTPEAVPFIVFAFSGGRIPLALGVMHILAIDLGTDLVPALALGAERPEAGLMDRPPRPKGEHIISRGMLLRAYGWLGPVQALAVMSAFFFHYWTSGYDGFGDLPDAGGVYRAATAMALGAVVTTQIGNLFAHRTERQSILRAGFFTNRLAWIGIASELAVIAAIVYLPPLQQVIGTAAFPLSHWWFLFAWAPALLVLDEARKAFLRRRERR